ncbi:class I SAM-dependent methyltransferase [Sciscionella sediminilitoris]|uniref:class I SAM-dependent methyltransferase n=1 Tax=Sciscionella sediminilitoris TaxID=1445613 RepID=UPI0004DF33A9|nr:class I SAM-dependent methyltransferase [Sciscionella sp. SE31]
MNVRTDFDSELRRYTQVLLRACGIRVRDRVLDIGCGAGQTTRHAARRAREGSALGVDVSAPSIDRARELAAPEQLGNLVFEHGDAQTHRFPAARFDVAISRFGTMFFADPAAAFGNIAQALRPDGRLVMLVWQSRQRNEWIRAIDRALAVLPAAEALDPFSLAEPRTVTEILETAGFNGIDLTDIREPVWYGVDVPAALDWIRGLTCTSAALRRMEPRAADHTIERLRTMLAAHASADGVWFDSSAWLITARRA